MLYGKVLKVDDEIKQGKKNEYQTILVEVEGLMEQFAVKPNTVKVDDDCFIRLVKYWDEDAKRYFHDVRFVSVK